MAPGQSQIKLTRNVYEGVMSVHGILPRILHEWMNVECANPEAVRTYLMMEWQVGYLEADDVHDLSAEDREKFYAGWEMFADWDHKTVMNNVHMQLSYELMSPVERAWTEIEELDAWCELMDL